MIRKIWKLSDKHHHSIVTECLTIHLYTLLVNNNIINDYDTSTIAHLLTIISAKENEHHGYHSCQRLVRKLQNSSSVYLMEQRLFKSLSFHLPPHPWIVELSKMHFRKPLGPSFRLIFRYAISCGVTHCSVFTLFAAIQILRTTESWIDNMIKFAKLYGKFKKITEMADYELINLIENYNIIKNN